MNTMRDAANWAVLPTDGSPVAAYINGYWVCQDWARFGSAPRLPIMTYIPAPGVTAFGRHWESVDGAADAQYACQVAAGIVAPGGYIALDVEAPDAPRAGGYTVAWCDGIRAGGFKPIVYTSGSTQHFLAAATTDWWLTGGDGKSPTMLPGCLATQWAWNVPPGVDLSQVVDGFPSGPAGSVAQPTVDPAPSNLAYPHLGSTGDAVKAIQEQLNTDGDYGLTVDGVFGNATNWAVQDFQRKHGLAVDGIVGPETSAALAADAPKPSPPPAPKPTIPPFPGMVQNGSHGSAVVAVQERLRDRGWRIVVDGDFGPATETIVREFQQQKGLTVDGIAGPETWEALWVDPITGN